MSSERVKVLVADGSAFFRDTLREVLQDADDIAVVAVAGTADEAVELAERHHPVVAIVDVHLHGDGLHAIRKMHRRVPETKIVALCGFIDAPSESELKQLGVVEYLIKGVPNSKIIAAVHRAADPSPRKSN